MKKLIIVFLLWVITILFINKLSVRFISDRTSYELPSGISVPARFTILPFMNFDGRNYLDIANQGYFQKGVYNLRGFLPFFPLLIKIFSLITKINLVYSGLSIVFFCAIASIYMIYRLVGEGYDKKTAFRVITLLLTFPTSFYLISYYTESFYLLMSLMVFWFLNKKKFLHAALFAAIASGIRITGLTLGLLVVYEGYRFFKEKKRFPWEVVFSPMGFVAVAIYNYITVNDPLAYLNVQHVYGKAFSIFGPIEAIMTGVKNVLAGPQAFFDSPFVYPVSILELASLVFFVALIVLTYKKIKMIYWYYMALNLYVFLAGGILQSLPRYLLLMFPIYIFLANKLKGPWFILYNMVSSILLIVLASIFLRGYWVA